LETTTLNELALKFGTDKSSEGFGYCSTYERVFGHLRHEPVKLLELGVCQGASLRMWDEYFDNPDSDIVGIDIDPPETRFGQRVRVYRSDQAECPDALRDWQPDIVVDDASHDNDKTQASFETWWPFVAPGGFYIVEDVTATYNHGVSSAMVFFLKLLDEANYGLLRSAFMAMFKALAQDVTKLPPRNDLHIEWMFFAANLVIVKKSAKESHD
jgi:hypothetical protein